MLKSMTGFATVRGGALGFSWSWELRSVNGKGLDLRLRLPDWIEGLEAAARARAGGQLARGSVTINLRLSRDETETRLGLNEAQLAPMLVIIAN